MTALREGEGNNPKKVTKKVPEKVPEKIEVYPQEMWQRTAVLLQEAIGKKKFDLWVAPLAFAERKEESIILHAPTTFLANWATDHYNALIRKCWENIEQQIKEDKSETYRAKRKIVRVDILCRAEGQSGKQDKVVLEKKGLALEKKWQASGGKERNGFSASTFSQNSFQQLWSSSGDISAFVPANENMRFDNFICGAANLLAYNTALSWAESYLQGKNNEVASPLFICGAIGQGKTHLLHAMASKLNKSARVINFTATGFRNAFVNALRKKEMDTFKQRFNEADILLMDDAQFLSGDKTQEEFFQLLQALHARGGKIAITSTSPPAELEVLEQGLRSRLSGGLVVDIYPADKALRQDIIRSKLAALSPPLSLPVAMIDFLAENITTSIRELEGALNRIITHTRHLGHAPDNTNARLILRDLLQTAKKQISISDIQKKTAEYFDISINDLLSARRQKAIVRPRQIAMYLAKQLTPRSFPDIGRRFGNRDHTTVLHAVRRVEELALRDDAVQKDVAALKALCQTLPVRKNGLPL